MAGGVAAAALSSMAGPSATSTARADSGTGAMSYGVPTETDPTWIILGVLALVVVLVLVRR